MCHLSLMATLFQYSAHDKNKHSYKTINFMKVDLLCCVSNEFLGVLKYTTIH